MIKDFWAPFPLLKTRAGQLRPVKRYFPPAAGSAYCLLFGAGVLGRVGGSACSAYGSPPTVRVKDDGVGIFATLNSQLVDVVGSEAQRGSVTWPWSHSHSDNDE